MSKPALSLLYSALDKRKKELTEYEAALYFELKSAIRPDKPIEDMTATIRHPSQLDDAMEEIRAPNLGDIGNLDIRIDLEPPASGPEVKVKCSYSKCPNKKRI
jgi:hypothetical protein